MNVERFDLNDIEHQPSDEQLASLMAAEAQRKARIAQAKLMARLRAELAAVQSQHAASSVCTSAPQHGGRPNPDQQFSFCDGEPHGS